MNIMPFTILEFNDTRDDVLEKLEHSRRGDLKSCIAIHRHIVNNYGIHKDNLTVLSNSNGIVLIFSGIPTASSQQFRYRINCHTLYLFNNIRLYIAMHRILKDLSLEGKLPVTVPLV